MVAALLVALGSGNGITEILLDHYVPGGAVTSRPAAGGSARSGFCFDSDYSIDVKADGTITFTGIRNGKKGTYTARFDRRQFVRLSKEAKKCENRRLAPVRTPSPQERLMHLVPSRTGGPLPEGDLYPDYSNPRNRGAGLSVPIRIEEDLLRLNELAPMTVDWLVTMRRQGKAGTVTAALSSPDPGLLSGIRELVKSATGWK